MSQIQVVPLLRPEDDAIDLLSADQARRYHCVPLRKDSGSRLLVAMSNPTDLTAINEIEFLTGMRVEAVESSVVAIDRAIESHYAPTLLPVLVTREKRPRLPDPPVIRIQKLVFAEAVRRGASELHVEPGDRLTRIRYRVDGLMQDGFEIPRWLTDRLIARIKVMARLDVSERRVPQDGHIPASSAGFEARLSTLPTYRGEAVVVRLLGGRLSSPKLSELGVGTDVEQRLRAIARRTQGILLVVGPTGAGKTTTLYALIDELRERPLGIVTIENPVEYRIDGIRQVQVDEKTGLTFHSALRSTLRQDPDVILVGEIRDRETAQIAFNAALTGHLVLSTLHATDGVSALRRLRELGVDRHLVSSALVGVLAQRLIRTNCPNCLQPDYPETFYLERLGIPPSEAGQLRWSSGCLECRFSGIRSRRPLLEILEVDGSLRALVAVGSEESLRTGAARRFRPTHRPGRRHGARRDRFYRRGLSHMLLR